MTPATLSDRDATLDAGASATPTGLLPVPVGYIVEFYTYTDGWRQARAGSLWRAAKSAEAYRQKWAAEQKRDFAWEPETRISMLVRAGTALVSA